MSDPSGAGWSGDGGPTMTRIGRALVVTLPSELDDVAFAALRSAVLERVRRAGTQVLVFEASGLELIDATEFRDLSAVARSAAWLGVRPVLVGLSAGIVRYLVDAGLDTTAFEAFGSLDDVLATFGGPAGVDEPGTEGTGERADAVGPAVGPAGGPEGGPAGDGVP